jgi:hypothetical protein
MVGQEVVKYHPINLHHVDIPTLTSLLTITTNVADLTTTTTTTVVVLYIYLSSPKSDQISSHHQHHR